MKLLYLHCEYSFVGDKVIDLIAYAINCTIISFTYSCASISAMLLLQSMSLLGKNYINDGKIDMVLALIITLIPQHYNLTLFISS